MNVLINLDSLVKLIREAKLSPEENSKFFKIILCSMHYKTLIELATDENTASEIIDELAKGKCGPGFLSGCAIENPNVSVETLDELVEEGRKYTEILNNPKTPAKILEKILNKKGSCYAADIAEHPNATSEILERLSHYDNRFILQAIAENMNTNSQTLDILTRKYYWNRKLMYAVIKHPNVKVETLTKLIQRYDYVEDIEIIEYAKKCLKERWGIS